MGSGGHTPLIGPTIKIHGIYGRARQELGNAAHFGECELTRVPDFCSRGCSKQANCEL